MSHSKLDSFYQTVLNKDYILPLPDEAVAKGLEFVLENYSTHFVSLDQFKKLVRQQKNAGLVLTDAKYRKYGLAYSPDPLDQYVAASMKRFDRTLYDSLKGYTKVPHAGRAYYTLLKYARPLKTSETLFSDLRARRCYEEALNDVRDLFARKQKKFKSLPLSDMMKQIPMETAAGFPYFQKKGKCVEACRRATISNYFDLLSGKRITQHPCQLALRGHTSPLDNIKTRPVWINSFDHIVLENIMFREMYDFTFNDSGFQDLLLTGPNTIKRLRDYLFTHSGSAFVNIDFSAWDTWPCRFAGRDLFKILKEQIDFDDGEEHVFNFVQKEFIDSEMALPDGSSVRKKSGTCTGSLLTSLFNSLLNFLCLRTAFRIMDVHLCVEKLRVLGDDAAFFMFGDNVQETHLSVLSKTLKEYFGLTLNPEKCVVAPPGAPIEERKFIGYSMRGSQLYRPLSEFFRSVLYTEHTVEDIRTSFSRVVSYLILGGIYHDRFCQFVSQYLGHYEHLLKRESNLVDPLVFHVGNLRVIKHVFQMDIDELIGTGLTLERFREFDFLSLPYRFTLGYDDAFLNG